MSFPYMPLYVGDYLKDTNNLNAEEHGAYLLLIFDIWNAGGSITSDPEDLRIRARVSRRRWPAVWYKLAPKFTLTGGRLEHKRVTAELTKAVSKSEVGRRAGMQSAKARSLKRKETRSTDVQRTFNQSEPEPDIEPLQGSISVQEANNVVEMRPRAVRRGSHSPLATKQLPSEAVAPTHSKRTSIDALRQELAEIDRIAAKYPETGQSPRRARIIAQIQELETS